jgi:hypothetical protein
LGFRRTDETKFSGGNGRGRTAQKAATVLFDLF